MQTWADLPFFNGAKFKQILALLNSQRDSGITVLPAKNNIFNAFKQTPFDQVRVVILGQDPYPNAEHAMGLSFSVPSNTKPLPPSLRNIFKELTDDIGVHSNNPDLTRWAEQGVLLLNTSLTVIAGKPGSHSDIGWQLLAKDVIQAVSSHHTGIVFILWGNHARTKASYIENSDAHLVLQSAHPSPLSAHNGFFGSKPFSKCNQFFASNHATLIEW